MKRDEEFFLENLSCGISRVRRGNRIVRLRGPLDLAVEIPCNSHETYDGQSDDIVSKSEYWNTFRYQVSYFTCSIKTKGPLPLFHCLLQCGFS